MVLFQSTLPLSHNFRYVGPNPKSFYYIVCPATPIGVDSVYLPSSCVLCCERVVRVVRLCRALQGNCAQAEQDHPAGATQCRAALSPSGGTGRLCGVLVSARPLSQLAQ